MPVYMKKKTNVSVQTSANITWNPLAISMVTTKPTVQKLCEGKKIRLTAREEAEDRQRAREQVLYRNKTKKKEKGKQRHAVL